MFKEEDLIRFVPKNRNMQHISFILANSLHPDFVLSFSARPQEHSRASVRSDVALSEAAETMAEHEVHHLLAPRRAGVRGRPGEVL